MGQVEEIFIKRAKGGPMDAAARATLKAGRGIVGNANQGGLRQVTLLARERWDGLMSRLGGELDASARRANVVLSGIDLENTGGRMLRVGACRLLVHGETKPCEQMEDALPGLRTAMREGWAGGVFAEVVEGGDIVVGDRVAWE